MKTQKNFTTGVLTGVCGVLMLLVLTGTTGSESANTLAKYEFYDLNSTKGLIFNKITGEIKYEEIREESELEDYDVLNVRLSNWNGLSPRGGGKGRVRFFN